ESCPVVTLFLSVETASVAIFTLSLHDALPIYEMRAACAGRKTVVYLPLVKTSQKFRDILNARGFRAAEVNGQSDDRAEVLADLRSEEHTSELQSRFDLVCRLLLEKKKSPRSLQ